MNARSVSLSLIPVLALWLAGRASADPTVADAIVERLSATHHTTSVRLDALDSSYHVAAPTVALENERLVLRNLDPRSSVMIKLHADGRPDLASAEGMLAGIVDDTMTAEAKAIAIWQFVVDWRYHYIAAETGDEIDDPVKLINVYGYGLCGNSAAGIHALSAAAAMPARIWSLGEHVVAEIWYDGGWHMFDADHEVYYRGGDGDIVSVLELAADPAPILATAYDPNGASSAFMASLYSDTSDNYVYPPTPASTHRIEPVLAPLDEVRFELAQGTVYSQSEASYALYPTYGPPPNFANGTLTRALDVSQPGSDWLIPVEWPFLLVGGELELALARDDVDVEISIACGSPNHLVVPTTRSGQTLTASLDSFFAARRIGSYSCSLRMRSLTAWSLSESVAAGQVDWLFQFAPRALQQVRSGGTNFRAELAPVGGLVPEDWRGFEIVHAWGETRDFAVPGAQHFEQSAEFDTDLVEAAASFDGDSIVLSVLTAGDPTQTLQVFLDTDVDARTGHRQKALGAEFVVENDRLYAYDSGAWSIVGSVSVAWLRPDVARLTIPSAPLDLIAGGALGLRVRRWHDWSTPPEDLPSDVDRWQVTVPHVIEQSGAQATDLVRANVAFDDAEMVVSLQAEASALQNVHVYLDTDSSTTSGYLHRGLGADFLIENGFLYRHTGLEQSAWSFSSVAPLTRATPQTNLLQIRVPLASLDLQSGTALTLRVEHWLHWDARLDSLPRFSSWRVPVPNVIAQSGASAGDLVAGAATVQPGSIVFTLRSLGGPVQLLHLYLNSDADPSTGYAHRAFGSDYLIENNALYRFSGPTGREWSWTRVGSVVVRALGSDAIEVVLPTGAIEFDGRRASVFVENRQPWSTLLDSLPQAPNGWQLAW